MPIPVEGRFDYAFKITAIQRKPLGDRGNIDVRTGEQWGNFIQTYSMVGLIVPHPSQ